MRIRSCSAVNRGGILSTRSQNEIQEKESKILWGAIHCVSEPLKISSKKASAVHLSLILRTFPSAFYMVMVLEIKDTSNPFFFLSFSKYNNCIMSEHVRILENEDVDFFTSQE